MQTTQISGWGQAAVHSGLDRDTVFGAVHATLDARATHGLTSVCVSPPVSPPLHDGRGSLPKLVWINVCACRHRHQDVANHFCERVTSSEIEQWRAHGWHEYLLPRYCRLLG